MRVIRERLSMCVFASFRFGFGGGGGVWDFIVLISDHHLSTIYNRTSMARTPLEP